MKSKDENIVLFEPVYQLCRATEHLTIREIFPASPPPFVVPLLECNVSDFKSNAVAWKVGNSLFGPLPLHVCRTAALHSAKCFLTPSPASREHSQECGDGRARWLFAHVSGRPAAAARVRRRHA